MLNQTIKYLVNNQTYKYSKIIKPTHIMLHSIAVNQPNKDIIFNNFNNSKIQASVHEIIDNNGSINCLPYNYKAWHCGGSGNNFCISCEMTEPRSLVYNTNHSKIIDLDLTDSLNHLNKVIDNTIDWVIMLMTKYNISIDNITTHADGYKAGIASNHGDPYHWWSIHNYTLDDFKVGVLYKMKKDRFNYVKDCPAWMQPYVIKYMDKKIINMPDGQLDLSYDMIRLLIMCERMLTN